MARSLNRYSVWDGSQKIELDADQILSALSEDLMEFGDLQQAMRYLMQRGMETEDGNDIRGLRDLLQQLKGQRRQRLERFDMSSIMDDIKRQLDEILDMERQTINEWVDRKEDPDDARKFMADLMQDLESNPQTDQAPDRSEDGNFSNQVLGNIGEQNKEFISNLPDNTAGKIKGLQDYEFLNTDAQKNS